MKWTSRGLAGLLALSSTASVAQQLQLPEDAARKAQIRRRDLAHAEAIFKGDTTALQELLPDDHTVNHPTNRIVQEKAELLRLIGENVIRYTRFEVLRRRYTNGWMRQNGKGRLAFRHANNVPGTPGK